MREEQIFYPADPQTTERLDVLTRHIIYLESLVKDLLLKSRSSMIANNSEEWTIDQTEDSGEKDLEEATVKP